MEQSDQYFQIRGLATPVNSQRQFSQSLTQSVSSRYFLDFVSFFWFTVSQKNCFTAFTACTACNLLTTMGLSKKLSKILTFRLTGLSCRCEDEDGLKKAFEDFENFGALLLICGVVSVLVRVSSTDGVLEFPAEMENRLG